MSRLIAVGNRAFVTALTGVGAESLRCESAAEFEESMRRLATQPDVRLLFVAEPLAEAAPEAMALFRRRSRAALLTLPVTPSDRHPALEQVRALVEQATGASLI
jgi:vacuolar-type H+-ATPase subunit F/Vma7